MIVPKNLQHTLLEQPTLSIIVCALACEAKPLIDFFKLKKNTSIHSFSVYQAGSLLVLVSGLGQNHMSAAVNWLSGYLNSAAPQFWLNVGVAGHASADVGDLFCAHKISHQQHSLYPTKWLKHKIALEQLATFNDEVTDYSQQGLYDMEGFAFYQAATRFNNQERVQCLKIVSDNKHHPINKDKQLISSYIFHHMQSIVGFIEMHTSALSQQIVESKFEGSQQQLLKHIHFTHNQQLQLAKLLQAIQSHAIDIDEAELLVLNNAKKVLDRLTTLLKSGAVEI